MKTKTIRICAVVTFILSIGLYYFLIQGIEWLWSDFCANNFCMKTLSLAEFLAIETALIGVYFVVSSLDDWKKENQYQTAKKNIKLLHDIYQKFEIYNARLENVGGMQKSLLVHLTGNTTRHTALFYSYKRMLNEIEITKTIQTYEYEITQQNTSLYQEDFNNLIDLAHSYIFSIDKKIQDKDKELIDLEDTEIDKINVEFEEKKKNITTLGELTSVQSANQQKLSSLKKNLKQSDIDAIHAQEHPKFDKFREDLKKLQTKLNDFVN